VARFAAAALVAVVGIGVALSIVLSRALRSQQQEAAQDHAEFVTNSTLRPQLGTLDSLAPMSGDDYAQLSKFVNGRVLLQPLVFVSIWGNDGTVIFSSVRSLVGQKFPMDPALRQAFATGTSGSVLTNNDERGALAVPSLPTRVLDTYVPVFKDPSRTDVKPVAVAELYTDDAALTATEANLFRHTMLTLVAALGILYLFLLPIAWRFASKIDDQNEQLELLLSRERTTQYERRRLLDRTLRAAEEERTRLAAELHDGPVQRLARLGYGLERVRTRQNQGDISGSQELLAEIQGSVFDEVKELRGMMSRLRPPVLDQRGLEDALRDRAEAIQEDTGVQCTVQGRLDGRLTPTLETVLYRVSQEALQNVVKHSRAKHARVVLGRNNGSVVLEIQDDGVGFQPSRAHSGGDHFGMLAMRERVEMIGGTWEVDSMPGQGTRVRVVLPWEGGR
jgi:signal transduction histidine kinase